MSTQLREWRRAAQSLPRSDDLCAWSCLQLTSATSCRSNRAARRDRLRRQSERLIESQSGGAACLRSKPHLIRLEASPESVAEDLVGAVPAEAASRGEMFQLGSLIRILGRHQLDSTAACGVP